MYIDEVLWNEFCHIYWLQNKDVLMQKGELMIGGLYGRKYKWKLNSVLLNHFEYGKLDRQYDLINAAMNQLRI